MIPQKTTADRTRKTFMPQITGELFQPRGTESAQTAVSQNITAAL
jgi:hypothetical protein